MVDVDIYQCDDALQDSFRDIGASEEIVQALLGMGIGRPSHIQAAAYRALAADSGYVVLADHAGECHAKSPDVESLPALQHGHVLSMHQFCKQIRLLA